MFLDIFFLVIIVIFTIMSAVQGFIHGLFSAIILVISALITYYFSNILINYISKIVPWYSVSSFLGYAATFLVAYFVLGRIFSLLRKVIEVNKSFDFLLGAVLGALKGFIICSIIIIILEDVFYKNSPLPEYIMSSQIRLAIHNMLNFLF